MSNLDALAIVNAALLQLGEAPIAAFEGTTVPQQVAAATYQPIVDSLLGEHPWWFNRRIAPLSRLTDPPSPAAGFSAAYQLPGLCFRIVVVYVNSRPACDWGLEGQHLLVDADADALVELEYHTRVDETQFHPVFRQAVVYRLAAEMCLPVCEDLVRMNAMHSMAETEMRRARHTNATEKPAPRMQVGRLAARMRR